MRQTHSLESIKKHFEEKGCKLLAKEYKTTKTKMKYICKCGKSSNISYNSFRYRKIGCRNCNQELDKKGVS